jgi:hypothetical protein
MTIVPFCLFPQMMISAFDSTMAAQSVGGLAKAGII